jgi:ribosomal protein L3 glutamine methyltransferase
MLCTLPRRSYCRFVVASSAILKSRRVIAAAFVAVTSSRKQRHRNSRLLELQTIHDIYRYAISRFNGSNSLSFGQGVLDSAEEATFLILHQLSLPFDGGLAPWAPCRMTKRERQRILSIIDKRIQDKVPMAYLLSACIHHGELLYVDRRCIIPRSHIGELLAASSDDDGHAYKNTPFDLKGVKHALDMCTGSGCLAVLLAKFLPQVQHIDAVDVSSDALEVATINLKNRGLLTSEVNISREEEKPGGSSCGVRLIQGDLFNCFSGSAPSKYDLIVCNPPYVDRDGMRTLPAEYSCEPPLALDGGVDGLKIIRRVLEGAANHMKEATEDNGYRESGLLLEVGRCRPQLECEYPDLMQAVHWIDTSNSSGGVLYVTRDVLRAYLG